MKSVPWALAGLSLILSAMPADAAPTPNAAPAKARSAKVATAAKGRAPKAKPAAPPPVETPVPVPSDGATRVIDWVLAEHDNRGLPFAVIDKTGAALFLFDGKGQPLAAMPVLIGIAPGDDASPGVGSKSLAALGPAEKTTPAGRFLAKFGLPVAGERVLWVDYADSVAIHPIPGDAGAREKRRERMLSPTPDDNRITFGCINVPKAFYTGTIRPAFRRKGGYVYIMPDTKPLEAVFPRLRVRAVLDARAGGVIARP